MRLKSLTLTGFKSFPDRTRLDFGPGVSVVVGPNGSGKSNVTDAVLWAMGEQSPLAVRGQSMQDVIFGGGRGVQARGAAEVEIVLDNSDGTVDLPLSEISIARRLDRNGEGGYRLNGARCRLTDVIEVLSDTGLGKETHSVISQGRVDAIVTSKARDRRLLIEEAAGLGKHRKRRRRAQLKLEHTQENLDRALDIEREARTRLRPLKRQAEAAELHERLEHQILQARWELARDTARTRALELAGAEGLVAQARATRAEIEARLAQTIERRGEAERALSERSERHDALSRRVYEARSAHERLGLRGEQAGASAQTLARRIERIERELASLARPAGEDARDAEGARYGASADGASPAGAERILALEAQLAEIESSREREIEREIAELQAAREREQEQLQQLEGEVEQARAARKQADEQAEQARASLAAAERAAQEARREAARVGAELAAANQFLRSHTHIGGDRKDRPKALSEEMRVQDGFELALAAALGGRLDASLVEDVAGAEALLDRSGPDGGTALVADRAAKAASSEDAGASAAGSSSPGAGGSAVSGTPPAPDARPLVELVSGPEEVLALARRLLTDAWVVERLEDVAEDFAGIAVTRQGRVWFASWGEVRQLSEGGTERVLARRNERDRLIADSERAAQAEQDARGGCDEATEQVRLAEEARAEGDRGLRDADRRQSEAAEARRRTEWLIEQRRAAPADGPLAVRKAEIEGELASERRQLERVERERVERESRIERLRAQLAADTAAVPRAERLLAALEIAAQAVSERRTAVEAELAEDRAAGEQMAAELRACAEQEAEIQAALRAAGEAVTDAEVAAQRLRDQVAEIELELASVIERLGEAEERESQPLGEEEIASLKARVERLTRRREQLGPVNPLAQEEYAEALAHVEELERQRTDLETALRELRSVIRETDRQIEETFEETFQAAARNFEELVGDVFPGGTGRLRLVHDEQAPRPVLGGQPLPDGEVDADAAAEAAAEAEAEAEIDGQEAQLPGVEIEITPAGKSTKRLTLLSGGEKSMTALAFLFAVFLARPCPFYIMDEVEAALDDLNLDRFLALLRRYADRAQFIVITHQKRTMEAADYLYGVSMGLDGVSKVISRRLPAEQQAQETDTEAPEVAEVA
ncbi:MAG TPA: AAA family ATPase [Solirubrobacteraceae bacterium]|nr:AAA family ATPase [Solirubrobacteraceae bacterium]